MEFKFKYGDTVTIGDSVLNKELVGLECRITGVNVITAEGFTRDYSVSITGHQSSVDDGDYGVDEKFLEEKKPYLFLVN